MQHFYLGLRQSSTQFLDLASKGAFLHLPVSRGSVVLATILDNTPYTNDHSDALEEDQAPRDETSSADATVATSQAVEPEPQSQTPPREEVIHFFPRSILLTSRWIFLPIMATSQNNLCKGETTTIQKSKYLLD